MPFRFGSFWLLSKLEMYKTPLTDCSTVHTVGFKHLETRPVTQYQCIASTTDPGPTAWRLLYLGTRGLTTQFQCIASTTDPGPTAWRLLYLGTRGLTVTLLHNFSVLQVLPTQVPPLGGCCIWGPAG
ncbi:hypothetical protein V1477_001030 [Vespula maculifrons]|uniref:Uncharacterized protein n=1 Tax=Vespula maculifrons TaxID=7453 RepID=A0ABD2D0K8_VESMC